ncbi:MAG: hypothetical protein GEU90_14955 [Gemmatimonas sp.]|nr:hypothetical protein [Gemmatimonas sp.]
MSTTPVATSSDRCARRSPCAHRTAELSVAEMEREVLFEVSAAVAARDPEKLERSLRLAIRFCESEEVNEVLLQSHLFVGFPITLEALRLWRGLVPTTASVPPAEPSDRWEERGEAVCRSVYGHRYEKLRANVRGLHPDFDRWMVVGGYGRVIGRGGLDLVTRELCIVALLAVWNTPRQLHSHLRGAVNCGATAVEVEGALEVASRYLEPERACEIWKLWARIGRRSEGSL